MKEKTPAEEEVVKDNPVEGEPKTDPKVNKD